MSLTPQALIENALSSVIDPYLQQDLIAAGLVRSIDYRDEAVQIAIELPYAGQGFIAELKALIKTAVKQGFAKASLPVDAMQIDITQAIGSHQVQKNLQAFAQIKNIIAIASGKGGVGKSSTAVNLALALQAEGAKVGLLDADIYGPSQPTMLGIAKDQRPEVKEQKYFYPIKAYGLQTMSMGYLVTDKTPMVWRGPMVSGALTQMLNQTLWEDLDYLLIDMPPGTGDIQLTLSQQVPVTGAAIVTTPQDIALLDAIKGIEMFKKVEIPCLGIIENMAMHICSQCGHADAIFGDGGGDRIAAEYGVELLGSLPLAKPIREGLDGGKPSVAANPESDVSMLYRQIARRLSAQLVVRAASFAAAPEIVISDD